MKVRTAIAACTLVAALSSPAALAQEESEPPAGQPQDPAEEPAQPTASPDASEQPKEKKKLPFGLYVYAGYGAGDSDPFNMSIVTTATADSENTLDIDGLSYARAAIGWKLPNKKGDFRLVFDGFAEETYEYKAIGKQAALGEGSSPANILDPLPWWQIDIRDGMRTSWKAPPVWTLNDDANGNGGVDNGEQRYPGNGAGSDFRPFILDGNGDPVPCFPDPMEPFESPSGCTNGGGAVTDDLLNRFQQWDLMYGRVWGPRRFQGRWFAGLRYMIYEGNLLASAWLNDSQPGEGFTDGSFLRMLNFTQKSTGLGPTGLLEARWNFFGQRLQVYLSGQVAFLLTSLETDTGPFFTLVNTTNPELLFPLPTRLVEEREKSTWNTRAEVGLRVLLKGGFELELAYLVNGYLDAILAPERIQIPANLDTGQTGQGVSAIYSTQDIVLDAWRFGIGFQF